MLENGYLKITYHNVPDEPDTRIACACYKGYFRTKHKFRLSEMELTRIGSHDKIWRDVLNKDIEHKMNTFFNKMDPTEILKDIYMKSSGRGIIEVPSEVVEQLLREEQDDFFVPPAGPDVGLIKSISTDIHFEIEEMRKKVKEFKLLKEPV